MWTVPRNLLEVMSPLEDVQATLPHLTLSIPKALGYCNPLLILPLRSNCFFSFSKKLSNLRSKEITKLGIPTEDFLHAPLEILPEAASNSMISFDIMLSSQCTLLPMWVLMYWKVVSNTWACLCEWTQAHTWLQVILPEEDEDISHLVATQIAVEEIVSQLGIDKQLPGDLKSKTLPNLESNRTT